MTHEELLRFERMEAILASIYLTDRFIFEKNIQITNGQNIQVGVGTGTMIGTSASEKISLHGVTPVVQAGAISSPAADVNSLKTAVDAIRVVLTNKGLTA